MFERSLASHEQTINAKFYSVLQALFYVYNVLGNGKEKEKKKPELQFGCKEHISSPCILIVSVQNCHSNLVLCITQSNLNSGFLISGLEESTEVLELC